ncbi:hypothetical protein KY290_023873 [Solanum tuberosum]|uniref:Uncharacterized protein n=1 Tax=Solanum tuberosum TaxID=4113 RepID=A0ABQ7UP27_SOLTU|nr:hypothetical protein KY284_014815 [Solanum tuberosum]KAH0704891.1 hypothetical protein KY289_009967 [Solanum tuberosum]KAH0718838.1 hypothetical protein KY285_014869 [Solanum tuberosum]KAH0753602.1 hypothetical protein KY290_023872 [Solanum tuberosum]KAH0753603.1 hypothetical protein KY290_023873 [Solanum tuberosum]
MKLLASVCRLFRWSRARSPVMELAGVVVRELQARRFDCCCRVSSPEELVGGAGL